MRERGFEPQVKNKLWLRAAFGPFPYISSFPKTEGDPRNKQLEREETLDEHDRELGDVGPGH